ncbi:hypothetical protein FPANT_9471 [Fusarium pseudoanthophilum]|uniref:C2H2-type domain-containing protein n=1 Tax=Fusarium pseudoanthophilum TaxID=48495 RepID=A0A8H5KWP1_9HYPO|nr:hypothetical protein FPANT_9471 [Fusarium pseudoanthophilum]
MQSDASAVPDQDGRRPAESIGVGDGTGPRGESSPVSVSSASLTCPECGQSFRRREHLIRHLDRHSGRRSYTCDVCKTTFSRRPAPCAKCISKGRRCVYQPESGDEVAETITVAHSAADDAISGTHSSPSQQVQPLTPLSSVPVQPWIEPELSWDTLLTSAQFLLPFSPVPSFESGALADFCFGDAAFATTGQPVDDLGVQNSFGAQVPHREAVNDIHDLIGHDDLTAEEEDILIAENIPHVPPVTEETRLYMIQAIKARLPQQEAQALDAKFPSLRHLDTYMQLYFEHLHPRMPLLHVPTFHTSPEIWQLVLAVICLGSRYSQAHRHHDHVLLLQRVAQHMVKVDLRELLSVNVLICAQSHLLFQHSLWLSGEWSIMVEAQFYRNTLVTLCRLFLSREGTLMHTPASTEDLNHAWFQWIQGEAKRRLVHFTYKAVFEFLYSSFVMLPPLLSAAELQTPVPSADRYWSSSRDEWHLLPPPPPSPTLCILLSGVGLGDVASAGLEQLTQCILLSSASVQLTAESDLLKAMGLDSSSNTASRPNPPRSMVTTLFEKAFDILSQVGCSEVLRETGAGGRTNDFALLSRVLAVLSFTPLSLLFSYTKWQATDIEQDAACTTQRKSSNTIAPPDHLQCLISWAV